jgi:cell division septal protein FtsQ
VGKSVTTRSREQRGVERKRPKSVRAPGVLRQREDVESLPSVQHGARGLQVNWRIFSGVMVVCLIVVIGLVFSVDAFYVHRIEVAGLHYLNQAEIYTLTGIANTHLFWVDAEQVRRNILQAPTVADAEVVVGWPPDMVRITITEREPALIWEQAGVPVWVDINGRVLMLPQEERPDLVHVVAEGVTDIVQVSTRIPTEVINGALQLRELLPQATTLRYHPQKGLGFTDPAGWDAWFGSGTDMGVKILFYKKIVSEIEQSPSLREIDVSNPDQAVICCDNF